jgi:hypothetical protein
MSVSTVSAQLRELASEQPGEELLPVLPALSGLLPGGGLRRGSVIAVERPGLLCVMLAAGASAAGSWCAVVGMPQLGVLAAADAGVDMDRLLLVPDPGPRWPQVAAALLEGCELVLLCPPARPSAPVARRLAAHARRTGGALVVVGVAGAFEGANLWLRVASPQWIGIGAGHGRLRCRRVQVVAGGRGSGGRPRTQWWWLPDPDGAVAVAEQAAAELAAELAAADQAAADQAAAERRMAADWVAAERAGAERAGAERAGAERAGAERAGAERAGAELAAGAEGAELVAIG